MTIISCGENHDVGTLMVTTKTQTDLYGAGLICDNYYIYIFGNSVACYRCSDASCDAYEEGTKKVQLAAYSYDNGVSPMENPAEFMKEFATTIETDTEYMLIMSMDDQGLTTFTLASAAGKMIESQYVQHTITCPDDYFKGTVQGLYFGGTCRAPEDVVIYYSSKTD